MKKFVSGMLAGAVLAGTVAFGAQYAADTATFKVLVNGKEFNSDKPIVAIEGSTYLPLKAIGEALGVPVRWNAELKQVEVGNSAPAAQENEYSRNNPVPLNTVQNYTKKNALSKEDEYTISLRIMEVVRGDEAMERLKKANQFNAAPEDDNYEYLLAKVAVSALSVADDGAYDANRYLFKSFSSNNEEIKTVSAVVDSPLEGKIYAGGSTEGWISVLVKKDDKEPKLAYGINYDGTGGAWFKLYE
nr:MAG TPA: copper amine oxidase [Caudoviricetes sp.]